MAQVSRVGRSLGAHHSYVSTRRAAPARRVSGLTSRGGAFMGIVSRSLWIVGIACLLLSTAVLAGADPSGRPARGVEPRAAVLGESVSGAASALSSRELSLDQRVAY